MNWYKEELVISDKVKIEAYGEHDGKNYLVYFENIPKDMMYFKFTSRWRLEEFLYTVGVERFNYKSSNGKVITKVWKYIPEEIENWKDSNFRTKKELQRGMPEKYSYDDWRCGHFIKEK